MKITVQLRMTSFLVSNTMLQGACIVVYITVHVHECNMPSAFKLLHTDTGSAHAKLADAAYYNYYLTIRDSCAAIRLLLDICT